MRTPGQRRSALASANTQTEKIVYELRRQIANNAVAWIQYMEDNQLPLKSLKGVSEALCFAAKYFIGLCEVLSPQILHTCCDVSFKVS